MNKVIITGRTTKDIKLVTTKSGKELAPFTIAINEFRGDKEYTTYVDCIAWNKLATNIVKFVTKGSLVTVEGKFTTKVSKDENGKFVSKEAFVTAQKVNFLSIKKAPLLSEEAKIEVVDDFIDDSHLWED